MQTSGLDDLRRLSRQHLNHFDKLTQTERRSIIEGMIQKVIIKPGENELEIVFFADEAQAMGHVNGRKKSTDSKGNGSSGRARTADKVINSHLLYQLSY